MGTHFSYDPSTKTNDRDQLIKVSRNEDTTGDFYGLLVDGNDILKGAGTGGPRSWVVGILADKTEGVITTAGCDDALLRLSGNNYVANGEIYNFRGLNCNISNRSGGIVGNLENSISVSAKVGSVQAVTRGLTVDAQHLAADTGDEFGGLDISLNREGGVNTVEYGLQIRTRGTINTAIKSAIRVKKEATDYGFTNLLSIAAAGDVSAAALSGDVTFTTDGIKIPIDVGGATYYLVAQPSI